VKKNDLIFFKDWFSDYCKSFYSPDAEDQKNIVLKEKHAHNVCKNIIEIAKAQSLAENEMMIAETIALFHDIGRFQQYAKYRTFKDSISVNHGLLGANILLKEKILQNLPDDEQELIIQTVKFHNAFTLPDIRDGKVVFSLKLIRDADKLDIWRIFIEYYEDSEEEKASAVGLDLPDTSEYSEEVLSYIHNKKVAPLSNLTTLNDLKIMQMTWVYDLYLKASFKLLSERDYINRIISTLPQTEKINAAAAFLLVFMNEKLKHG
jgi:putative nucleotidyltransferase with HDIG domain